MSLWKLRGRERPFPRGFWRSQQLDFGFIGSKIFNSKFSDVLRRKQNKWTKSSSHPPGSQAYPYVTEQRGLWEHVKSTDPLENMSTV